MSELDARLRKAREEARGKHGQRDDDARRTGIGFAFRIGVELVAALAVGAGIGIGLDRWLGTAPWLMVAFFLLGAGSGFMNIYRVMAGYGGAVGHRAAIEEEGDGAAPGTGPGHETDR